MDKRRYNPDRLWLDGTVDHAPMLGSVVGAYKSLTTVAWIHHIKATDMPWSGRLWQDNYYERVIRDNLELEQIRQYIRNNPIQRKELDTKPQ